MSQEVQRFTVRGCPAPDHPEYYSWQTANICIFVGEDNKSTAVKLAESEISKRKWLPISEMTKETLIEEIVFDEGGEAVCRAYKDAKKGMFFFGEWLEQIPMAKKDGISPMKAPRIDESFIDEVIFSAGGRRPTSVETKDETVRNADYVLDDAAIELKDLQREGLLDTGRQERLSKLFRGIATGTDFVELSQSSIPNSHWTEYLDILGRPIQNQVKSAAKQIKETRQHVAAERGILIFLNTGYSSLPHKLFEEIVARYCHKDTSQIDENIAISSWLITNGFDSQVFFTFDPVDGGSDIVKKVRAGFWNGIEEMMTQWGRSGFGEMGDMLQPIEPIAFSHEGTSFSTKFEPLRVELDKEWK